MREWSEIRDEELLLLRLCRLSFKEEQISEINELIRRVSDWGYFAVLANDHGVIAIAYYNLKKLGYLSLIPSETETDLKNKYMVNISRNAFHTTTINELVRLFDENKIKMVLLKGLALEFSVYGNAGLRQMTDIDILIERSDEQNVRKILFRCGYEQLPVKSVLHKPIISYLGKHLPSFVRSGSSLDIHLELFPGFKNGLTKRVIETSLQISANGHSFNIPEPQIFFIYLIKHLWNHELTNESQLRLYTDLIVLVEKYPDEILNQKLTELAADAGVKEVLAEKLKLISDFWMLTFPEAINTFIVQNLLTKPESRFLDFLRSPKGNEFLNDGKSYRKTIREIPGIHRKILYIAGDIFPTFSFMKNRYRCTTKIGAMVYYPHRLGKIVWLLLG
jgi:hypothetical protein